MVDPPENQMQSPFPRARKPPVFLLAETLSPTSGTKVGKGHGIRIFVGKAEIPSADLNAVAVLAHLTPPTVILDRDPGITVSFMRAVSCVVQKIVVN